MNKTAKYISARQLGRNAIITLGLGNKKKKREICADRNKLFGKLFHHDEAVFRSRASFDTDQSNVVDVMCP